MQNEKYVYYMFKTKWLFWKLVNIGYKTGIYPTLPVWILPLGKKEKKRCSAKFFIVETESTEERIIELEYHNFVIANDTIKVVVINAAKTIGWSAERAW